MKNSELQLKMSSMEDDMVDKREACDQYMSKLNVLSDEVKEMSEQNEQLLIKIKQYEDTGAILPDDEDGEKTPENQTQKMQREIVRLNNELKAKNTILAEITSLPDLDPRVLSLIDSDAKPQEEKKALDLTADSEIKRALLDMSDMSAFDGTDSFFLTESEVSTLIDNTKIL